MSVSIIEYNVGAGLAGIFPKISKGRLGTIMEQQAEDHKLEQRLAELEQRIFALEAARPKTNLLSKGFWGRAFGIWGYVIVAQLVVSSIVWLPLFLLGLLGR
jgi:hypothetical protein